VNARTFSTLTIRRTCRNGGRLDTAPMKFSEIELKDSIRRSLSEMGYEDLTPIQEATFPIVLKGSDLLAMAETGSGKTSACGIPLVQAIDTSLNKIQGLVLVPTRELALQYVDEIDRIAKYSRVKPFAIFGGFSMDIQKAKLRDGVHVLIATPGRLIDLIYQDIISLSDVTTFVLDEADEMMNMGFIEDIHFVMSCMVHSHQTLMFSATMPKDVEKLAQKCLDHPERIELIKGQSSPQSLVHQFAYVAHHARVQKIKDLLTRKDRGQIIVFCNSRHSGEKLFNLFKAGKNDSFDYIHGGLEQNVRSSIFNKFKSGKIDMLIATDVAGRGLDFAKVTHVVNYDFPMNRESYTHRTGRAGRMGREGWAITYVTPRELGAVKRLIEALKLEHTWDGVVPSLDENMLHESEKRITKKRTKPRFVHEGHSTSNPANSKRRPGGPPKNSSPR
jgi:ATP-dependent RNA helicase DeaD